MRCLSYILFITTLFLTGTPGLFAQEKDNDKPTEEKPAIEITGLSVSPLPVQAGKSIDISCTVANNAMLASGNFQLTIVAGNELVGRQQLNIAGRSKKTVTLKWTVPVAGEYYIRAIADAEKALDEVDRSDNISELKIKTGAPPVVISTFNNRSIPVLPTGIDLQVKDVSVQGHKFQADRRRMVTVSFSITNFSSADVNRPFKTILSVRSDSGFKKEFPGIVPKIGKGQTIYFSYTIQNAPHRFNITIQADAENTIPETDKKNNLFNTFFENPVPPVNRWISAGPDIMNGFNNIGYPWPQSTGLISVVAINPRATQVMYAGSPFCGIWKTNDGGGSWAPLTDKITLSVSALALSPGNPDVVYWMTERKGFFRSLDGGNSWVQLSTQNLNTVVPGGKLVVFPGTTDVILAKSKDGVYRSADGGSTWTLTLTGSCSGLEINANATTLYAAISTANDSTSGVFVSFDKGLRWRKMIGCPGGTLPSQTANTNILTALTGSDLYVGFRTPADFQLYRTTTFSCSVGGTQDFTWEKAWHTTTDANVLWGQLWANPFDNNSLYLGGTAFWRSTDKGTNFSKVSDYNTATGSAHADHHGFAAISPGKTIFAMGDGGIYRSDQNGNEGSWSNIGSGISNVMFYDFADAFTNGDLLIGGTQDNGTIETKGTLDWKAINGGDGATVDIDNSDENIMYSMNQFPASIAHSTNGGQSWSGMAGGLPTDAECFNIRFQLHPKNMNILLAACTSLWRTTMPGSSWATIFTPPSGTVNCSSVEPTTDTYLAGTSGGELYAGIGGTNFTRVFSNAALTAVNDIECDPGHTTNTYISCDGLSTGRIYLLKKDPQGIYTKTDITGNLPQGEGIHCIAVDRMNDYTIYAGTVDAVFKGFSLDQGNTWQWASYMDGLPVADIRDLEVHPVTGALRAATFGRSLFEISTGDPLGSLLAAEGKINFFRINDMGTKFGPPNDVLDAETIVQLDNKPGLYLGLQLRTGINEEANKSELKLLREAFEDGKKVRIEYIKNGLHSGRILRVIL